MRHGARDRALTGALPPVEERADGPRPGDHVAVLVNSSARRAGHGRWRDAVEAVLARRFRPSFRYPASQPDMVRAAHACVSDGLGAVVVAGGDGTVNAVAGTLAGARVPMGVLPLGTGNDLVRTLGLPPEPVAAARALLQARPRRLDLVEVNGRPFCTVGLLGIVAESAVSVIRANATGSRWRPFVAPFGAAAYRVSGVASLLAPRRLARRVQITYRDPLSQREHTIERDAVGFFIANGRHLGGGLALPVQARVDDGAFEICIVRATARARLLWGFACLVQGWTLPEGVLEVLRADRATIAFAEEGPFSADGEDVCAASRFDFCVRPAALTVLAGPNGGTERRAADRPGLEDREP